ncbi:MAG TPA: DUF4932 domain-containing protein, partial [candidate division Zixibacteria bacterium]|nr:DUF4932 domain-containing protein [candidate division Zixibacteria bacterium]
MVRTSKLFIINMLTLISASLFGSVESAAAAGRLVVEVDPRIELLAAVQAVSGYNERLGLLTQLECSYKTALYEHFTPFADHQAVAMFDSMSAQSFSF